MMGCIARSGILVGHQHPSLVVPDHHHHGDDDDDHDHDHDYDDQDGDDNDVGGYQATVARGRASTLQDNTTCKVTIGYDLNDDHNDADDDGHIAVVIMMLMLINDNNI